MASFSAELRVQGHVFPVLRCEYGTHQATDNRGRVTAKVRYGPVELLLDVPDTDFLVAWAADPHKRYAVDIVFRNAAGGNTIETLSLAGAYCVGYREVFVSGDVTTGAYQCQLTLSDPGGWTLRPGGPSLAFAPTLTPAPPVLPAPPPAPVEVTPPVPPPPPGGVGALARLLARLLALLPELGVAAAIATLIPTNSKDDPGYRSEWDFIRRHTPPTDKDRAELADLERRHEAGTLTAEEEQHLLALLARVKGLRLVSLSDADYNEEWDRTAPPELVNLDLQSTLDHVEYRDFSGPRDNGIGGAHNAVEFAKHDADYHVSSRVPHPSVPGVEEVRYQIPALDAKGKSTGQLKARMYTKTVYDPQVWPRPRLERALKEALLDAHAANQGTVRSPWWDGTTREGYMLRGTYRNGKIDTFFFQ